MTNEDVKSLIRNFVAQSSLNRLAPADDDDIFAVCVDEMFAMQLVAFVEKAFGISLGMTISI